MFINTMSSYGGYIRHMKGLIGHRLFHHYLYHNHHFHHHHRSHHHQSDIIFITTTRSERVGWVYKAAYQRIESMIEWKSCSLSNWSGQHHS